MNASDQTPQYEVVNRPPLRWTVRGDLKGILDDPVFTSFGEFVRTTRPRIVTRSKSKTTIITPLDSAGPGREFIIKNYRFPRLYQRLRSIFHRTVAVKELRMGREIEARGIPVSVPAAIAERRTLGMVGECFVIIEYLPGRMDMEDYLLAPTAALLAAEETAQRRRVIDGLAALLRQLHENGIYQYDCNLCNFLLEPASLSLTFIDLAKVSISSSSLARHKRVDNLAKLMRHRLRIPAVDAMRFLRGYVGRGRDKRAERHKLAREVSRVNISLLHGQFAKETGNCLREGRNFQTLECAECTAVFRKQNYAEYADARNLLTGLFHAAQQAVQASGRHGAAFKHDLGGGEELIWAFEGRTIDLDYMWRERNGLYPAGAWDVFPLGLCRMKYRTDHGMLFLIPAPSLKDKRPFLELSRAERLLLDEISEGVEDFGRD